MKSFLALLITILSFISVKSQVGIGTSKPHSSAVLELQDTTRGLLIPRMKQRNRLAIPSPAEGLLVYQTDSSTGYWYYKAGQWKPLSDTSRRGRYSIILTGNITNSEAQAKIANECGTDTRQIKILGCTQLTAIEITGLTEGSDILIRDNPLLQMVSLPKLETTNKFLVYNCPILTTLNLPALQVVGDDQSIAIDIMNCAFTSLDFPSLKMIVGNFRISRNPSLKTISLAKLNYQNGWGDLNFELNDELTSILLNSLTTANAININLLPRLAAISFPSLNKVNTLTIQGNTLLGAIQLPVLTNFSESLAIRSCSNLTSLSAPSLQTFGSYIDFNDNKLPSGNINAILNKLVAITPFLTGKTISLVQAIPAPPTGQGVIDRATLISRGNTVATN